VTDEQITEEEQVLLAKALVADFKGMEAEIKRLKAALSRIAYDEWEDGLALGDAYNMSFLKGLAIEALNGGDRHEDDDSQFRKAEPTSTGNRDGDDD
jgi:hypothetical protein